MPLVLGIIILGAIFLLVVLQGGAEGPEVFQQAEVASVSIQKQANDIKRDAQIPQGFFGDELLGQFIPYEPITIPDQWGKSNPFLLENPEDENVEIEDQDIEESPPEQPEETADEQPSQ